MQYMCDLLVYIKCMPVLHLIHTKNNTKNHITIHCEMHIKMEDPGAYLKVFCSCYTSIKHNYCFGSPFRLQAPIQGTLCSYKQRGLTTSSHYVAIEK